MQLDQQQSILTLALFAAFADGHKGDSEREEIRRIAQSLAQDAPAIDLPRLFPLPGTNEVEMEHRLRSTIGPEFTKRGFEVKAPESAMGGAQAIWIDWDTGVLHGASDPRKDGCALGH